MQNAHRKIVREQMVDDKERSAEYYRKSAGDLPPLPKQEKVCVQLDPKKNQWAPATITQTPTATQPNHTLWSPRMELTTKGRGDSSSQLK